MESWRFEASELPIPGTKLKGPLSQVPIYFCYLQSALFACAGLRSLRRYCDMQLAYPSWPGSFYLGGMFGYLMAMRLQLKAYGSPFVTTVNAREHRKTLFALSTASLSPFVISFV